MDELSGSITKQFHKGGLIQGGSKLKSSEEFIKVLKGEAVVTSTQMNNFMNKTLPMIANGGGSGGEKYYFDSLIRVDNATKESIPMIKSTASEAINMLNKGMFVRGYTRSANNFSI